MASVVDDDGVGVKGEAAVAVPERALVVGSCEVDGEYAEPVVPDRAALVEGRAEVEADDINGLLLLLEAEGLEDEVLVMLEGVVAALTACVMLATRD
jgi:hypothetical protein